MSTPAKDWERCYAENDTGWDLRGPTPPLEALLASGFLRRLGLPERPRVLVPGCGRGHDLRALATAGCDVTGVDLVPAACAEARELLALNRIDGRVLCRDLFGLLPELGGRFDLVYEYTCLCALPRHLRSAYGDVMAGVLVPRGIWLGLVYPMRPSVPPREGPPYVVTEADLRATLSPHFDLETSFEPENSVARRAGAERWFLWRKQGVPSLPKGAR